MPGGKSSSQESRAGALVGVSRHASTYRSRQGQNAQRLVFGATGRGVVSERRLSSRRGDLGGDEDRRKESDYEVKMGWVVSGVGLWLVVVGG